MVNIKRYFIFGAIFLVSSNIFAQFDTKRAAFENLFKCYSAFVAPHEPIYAGDFIKRAFINDFIQGNPQETILLINPVGAIEFSSNYSFNSGSFIRYSARLIGPKESRALVFTYGTDSELYSIGYNSKDNTGQLGDKISKLTTTKNLSINEAIEISENSLSNKKYDEIELKKTIKSQLNHIQALNYSYVNKEYCDKQVSLKDKKACFEMLKNAQVRELNGLMSEFKQKNNLLKNCQYINSDSIQNTAEEFENYLNSMCIFLNDFAKTIDFEIDSSFCN